MHFLIDEEPAENGYFSSSLPTTLDAPDVYGLFQSFSGVRYFVINRGGERTFVALNHPSHRPFSVIEPSQSEPEYGCWWGHVWVHVQGGATKAQKHDPGVLRLRGGKVSLRCHTSPDTTSWVPLALYRGKSLEPYSAWWSIEATKPYFPCVDFSAEAGVGWGTEHHQAPPIDDWSIPMMMKF